MEIEERSTKRLGREFTRTDAKARVVVPQRMRDALGDSVTMTTGLMNEIHVYPDQDFESKVNALLQGCESKYEQDWIDAHMIAPAEGGLKFDGSGRLTILRGFREESKIGPDTDVALVWRPGGWLEIWNRDEYRSYRENPSKYKSENRDILKHIPGSAAQAWLSPRGGRE